jgi:hypothetical protein
MNRIVKTILALISLFTASAVLAADYSDLYVIPIAGHAPGAHGTSWRSDVVLHNLQPVPITVEMAFIESGRSPAADAVSVAFGAESSLQLLPGETRVVTDVLGQQGRDVTGALVVGAAMPFVVTSRTYAELSTGRTLGQTVLPIAISGGADALNEVAVLTGLVQGDENQRSNIGLFLAASRAPFVVEIEVVSASGEPLGSRVVVLDAEGLAHHQFPVTGVSAVVRVLQGDGIVVPYASIIDNVSAEALFVSTDAATSRGATARTMLSSIVARTGAR